MRMAPNAAHGPSASPLPGRFNEGGHAHGPESPATTTSKRKTSSFNEGGHAHGPEWLP